MTRDWVEWHMDYELPDSALSQRRSVVVEMIRHVLDTAPYGPIRVLSLCAGDAADIAQAATNHQRALDLEGCVVEMDPSLARRAAANLARTAINVEVRTGDAGATAVYDDVLPVDLLLLVGIFGNIDDEDIQRTVAAVPHMCRPGATIVWSRHRREPDLTGTISQWFDEAGCPSTGFQSPGAGKFAIGRQAQVHTATDASLPDQLFSFRDDGW